MITIKTKMAIKNVPYSKLLKLEIPELADKVLGIVERHNPEELLIEKVYDLLVKEKPQMLLLTVRAGVHPLTLKLKPTRKELMLRVRSIKFQLSVATQMQTDTTRESVSIVQLAVNNHLMNLKACKNEEVVNQTIGQFLNLHNTSEELQTAVESLGFTSLVDDLQSAHTVVKEVWGERLALTSLRSMESTKDITDSVTGALDDLYKELEVAQLKNPLLDYKPLFKELNGLLKHYRYLINLRLAYNLRKAEEKKAMEANENVGGGTCPSCNPIVETGETVAPMVFKASANGNFAPEAEKRTNANVIDTDFDQSLKQKEAAAMLSKAMQLPQDGNDVQA